MKLSEFKKTILKYRDEVLRSKLRHFDIEILFEVEYSTGSSSKDAAFIDEIYIDKVKNRLFYVGKSKDLKRGWFSRKGPLKINLMKFFKWAESSKYNDFEIYFAWNYDYKDQNMFDYVPLSNEVKAEPLDQDIEKLTFSTEKEKPFRIKVRSLHEKLQNRYTI